jgi:hypothetical protein
MKTPEQLLAEAEEAERMAAVVSYRKDRRLFSSAPPSCAAPPRKPPPGAADRPVGASLSPVHLRASRLLHPRSVRLRANTGG